MILYALEAKHQNEHGTSVSLDKLFISTPLLYLHSILVGKIVGSIVYVKSKLTLQANLKTG